MGQCRHDPRKGRQPLAGGLPPRHRRADQGRGGPVLSCAGAWPHRRGGAGVIRAVPHGRMHAVRRLGGGASARLRPPVAPLRLRRRTRSRCPAFLQAVTLLGPRSMDDIREAALATLAPAPDRRDEFEALFRSHFYGDGVSRPSKAKTTRKPASRTMRGAREEQIAGRAPGGRRRAVVSAPSSLSDARLPARRRRAGRLPPQAGCRLARRAAPSAPCARTRAASSICAVRCGEIVQRRWRRALAAAAPPADRAAQAAAADRHLRLDEAAHRRLSANWRMRSCKARTGPRSSPSARG